MAARDCLGFSSWSNPHILTVPEDFLTNPARMLIRVDFPAPFGPNNPKIVPLGISRSIPDKAIFESLFLFES